MPSNFRNLKKYAYLALMTSLEKAIWNWMDNYPHEFKELQRGRALNDDLSRYCDIFFDMLDTFAETKKQYRSVVWPLQLMLLVLTPKVGRNRMSVLKNHST